MTISRRDTQVRDDNLPPHASPLLRIPVTGSFHIWIVLRLVY